MGEKIMFLIGVGFGGLLMFFVIIRIIAGVENRWEKEQGRR